MVAVIEVGVTCVTVATTPPIVTVTSAGTPAHDRKGLPANPAFGETELTVTGT
jgi:hypothetical protein